jgi:hypothetical protein
LNFYAVNLQTGAYFARWIEGVAFYFAMLAAIVGILSLVTKKWIALSQVLSALSIATLVFFNYQLFTAFFPAPFYFWVLSFVALPIVFLKLEKINSSSVLLASAAALLLQPAYGITKFFLFTERTAAVQAAVPTEILNSKFTSKPNVFYLVLDAYGNDEEIKRSTSVDVSSFIENLRSKGFYYANLSQTNYPWTYLAIGSALDMRLLAEPGKNVIRDRTQFNSIIQGEHLVRQVFKNNGYKYLHFENRMFEDTHCGGLEDECILQNSMSPFWRNILTLTPYTKILEAFGLNGSDWRKIDLDAFLLRTKNYRDSKTPFFLFAHIYSPHSPNWLTADCLPREKISMGFSPKPYADQVQCINKLVTKFLDDLLAVDPTAVVILQGDHGPFFQKQNSFSLPLSDWTQAQLLERMRIFSAHRYPAECKNLLYPTISPVNTFRVLIACLSGTKPLLAEDRTFLTPHEKHFQYGDVIEVHADVKSSRFVFH